MKKIFALALAAVMTAGMTTVAFAANDPDVVKFTGNVYYDVNGDGEIAAGECKTVQRGSTGTDTLGGEIIPGGKELYFELQADYGSGYVAVDKLDDLKSWEVAADWTVEDDKVDTPKFVQAKVGSSYGVYLKVVLPENETVTNKDIVGTIGLGDTKTDAKNASGHTLANVVVTYGRDKTNLDPDIKSFEGDFPAAFETKGAVVDFDDVRDEIDINFNDLALFTVDVTGQGKLDLRFHTDFDSEVAAMYDYANIDFLTFTGEPVFNKNGIMYIYADEDAFVYEVTADGVKEITGLDWDEDYEAWTFKTRKLTRYAISDVELDEKTVVEDKDETSSTVDGGKENPDTGR